MSYPQLDNLVRIGRLKVEPPAEGELKSLLRSCLRRLDDAERGELAIESRFDLTYNAAHALALAELRVQVCRSASVRHAGLASSAASARRARCPACKSSSAARRSCIGISPAEQVTITTAHVARR